MENTGERKGDSHEWHSVKPNTLGLKVLRQKTPAHRPMINNMISISLDGKPCVSEAYSVIVIHTSINIMLIRVERKSLIRKMLILIRVPFETATSNRGQPPIVSSVFHGAESSIPAPIAWPCP